MDVIAIVLIVCGVLKVVEIANAIRWLGRHGEAFGAEVARRSHRLAERGEALSKAHYYQIAERLGGDFFPFGYKDLRLVRTRHGTLFRQTLGRLERFTAISAAFSITGLWLTKRDPSLLIASPSLLSWLLYALSIEVLLCAVLIAIEGTYSFAILQGYAEPFHMQRPRAQTAGARLLLELRFIGLAALVTSVAATAGVFVVSSGLSGFAGMPPVVTGAESVGDMLNRILDALYFVVSTLATVGYGDIHPTNAAGRVLVVLLELGFFLLVSATLLTMTVARGRDR